MVESLNKLGVTQTLQAGSLREGRRLLIGASVECMLVGLRLPDAAGIEAFAVLAAAAPDVPIIAIGAGVDTSLAYAAMAEGAEEYVDGPTIDALADALVRSRQRRRGRMRTTHRPAQLAAVLDEVLAPAAVLDGAGRVLAVNRAWQLIAGAARMVEAWGVGADYLAVCDRAVGADAEMAGEAAFGIREVLAGDSSLFSMDYAYGEQWFSMRVIPVGELGGGALITHLEVTDLKNAEDRVRGLHPTSLQIEDPAAPLRWVLGADGTVLYRSPETLERLAVSDRSVSAFARIHPADGEVAREALERVIASPGRRVSVVLRAADGSGRWRLLDLVGCNLLDDPRVRGIVVTGNDITEGRLGQIAAGLESRLLQRLPAAVIVTDDHGIVV